MHLLNGGRLYISPEYINRKIEQQLKDCLEQVKNLAVEKRVYRLNFFVDLNSESYFEFSQLVEKSISCVLSYPVISSIITQPPLNCRILTEVYYYDDKLWRQESIKTYDSSAFVFRRDGADVLIGQVQCQSKKQVRQDAVSAFTSMKKVLSSAGFTFRSVIRQWNYIEDILGHEGEKQRYQEFNNVRTEFYDGHFSENGYPAATGIGMLQGGVLMEFLAVNANDAVTCAIDNPGQVAAHVYSPAVLAGGDKQLKSTPKFERARYFRLFGQKQLFVSGTASIRGEKTIGAGDAENQMNISIENVKQLYSGEIIYKAIGDSSLPAYGHARVYIKNRGDYPEVRRAFEKHYGGMPVVYLIADICRNDLLVEIEGKIILE